MYSELILVFVAGLVTALATGLGVVPVWLMRACGDRVMAVGNVCAALLMITVSVFMIIEAWQLHPLMTMVGVLCGCVGLWALQGVQRCMQRRHGDSVEQQRLRRLALVIVAMTAHSAAEGIGVGVSFAGTVELSFWVTASIALHNIPEGIAIALVMMPQGYRFWYMCLCSVGTSLPQPILAMPAFASVAMASVLLPAGLGFAAGAMIMLVCIDLIPEALHGWQKAPRGMKGDEAIR